MSPTFRLLLIPLLLSASPARTAEKPATPPNMAWIAGGTFTMGTDDPNSFPNEGPAHQVTIHGYWIDVHPVTNAEFARFVETTGYVTIAERPVDWEELKKQVPPGTPKPPDESLQPGALVFTPPDHAVPLNAMSNWWSWKNGADWRHPEGPGSSIADRSNHPVVQIAWDDAVAYAKWAGKRLPTEAEWEFAARGGTSTRFWWGSEITRDGKYLANTFQGDFPHNNTAADGYARTSPVDAFPANGYGLRDMAGNVWNWCSDIYRADTFVQRAGNQELCGNPTGPDLSKSERPMRGDPSPAAVPGQLRHVVKGGSFLCHISYCESYRPTARRGVPPDTGSAHTGFRCVMDAPSPVADGARAPSAGVAGK